MKIIWSEKAGETLQKRIDYLKIHWTEKEIRQFTKRVFDYLETLANEPLIARPTYKTKNTHIGVIIKQVSVIYRVKPGKNVIELVAFIDNRQNPKKTKQLL
ncbi:type II toxin-antitoxin system RelE/ParE family toxin [uncultured Mucilaginibacter sp.]|uniref:type II toxin-antitoxin system RelE/ParE family toxin n=1 Tax=uncultured Mucilaginibacter sp. TaxID=797541 RepID=UPI0025CE5FD4|nr:type II toxin-antitoxin system RelE/ParE family toxin [uncultured Mucilaginibacter sp.]